MMMMRVVRDTETWVGGQIPRKPEVGMEEEGEGPPGILPQRHQGNRLEESPPGSEHTIDYQYQQNNMLTL